MLSAVSAHGGGMLDADTILNAASWEAALGAAGSVVAAAAHAHSTGTHAFAAVRPPGHHALEDQAMGFCLLANVVIGAREAQALGRDRVLIVDWDVHHGNGTQALVEQDPTVRFVSLHQWPAYPGTGTAAERGVGNVFNVPRSAGLSPARYLGDLRDAVERAVQAWTPSILFISAGYDSMLGDPLGGFTLEPGHYSELVGWIRTRLPEVPIVAVLEGGYAPARVAEGVVATLKALE
jgi:acetoin utilization deacetylase AcuC-like enzyme